MPELPEVEVVKRSLEKKILNLVIKNVKINESSLRYKLNKDKILKLKGKKFTKIHRRSKFLIFFTDQDDLMLVHLGMTGKFFFTNKKYKKFKTSFYYELDHKKDQKHNRVIFFFRNNEKLIYNDVRKFGFIKFYKLRSYLDCSHLAGLGPEPLKKDWSTKYFKKYILRRNRTIKDILMDQKFVSGLGNIYVNEILFLSKIRPTRKVLKIKNFEIDKIVKNTKKILKSAIEKGGSSIKDFSSDSGKKGVFQQHFKVYGKEGEKCSNTDCNQFIIRTVISNRSTFFCKRCQK
tara:strand:- start:224 stop:1093 length:870 start_codon:yes stop_codon:yes gene_type:complete